MLEFEEDLRPSYDALLTQIEDMNIAVSDRLFSQEMEKLNLKRNSPQTVRETPIPDLETLEVVKRHGKKREVP